MTDINKAKEALRQALDALEDKPVETFDVETAIGYMMGYGPTEEVPERDWLRPFSGRDIAFVRRVIEPRVVIDKKGRRWRRKNGRFQIICLGDWALATISMKDLNDPDYADGWRLEEEES